MGCTLIYSTTGGADVTPRWYFVYESSATNAVVGTDRRESESAGGGPIRPWTSTERLTLIFRQTTEKGVVTVRGRGGLSDGAVVHLGELLETLVSTGAHPG